MISPNALNETKTSVRRFIFSLTPLAVSTANSVSPLPSDTMLSSDIPLAINSALVLEARCLDSFKL
ncbi:MAG: hypothetical protein P8L81_01370 [Hellea sp.]|nr:hypothetical protein [Hellea sp.]